MIDNFFEHLAAIYPDFSILSPEELYQKVVLASIVEREYRDPDEAPLIASVFQNRLSRRMALGSCATVVYVLTEEQKNHILSILPTKTSRWILPSIRISTSGCPLLRLQTPACRFEGCILSG
jgi:cell division protein YceG involved in septum cleavage